MARPPRLCAFCDHAELGRDWGEKKRRRAWTPISLTGRWQIFRAMWLPMNCMMVPSAFFPPSIIAATVSGATPFSQQTVVLTQQVYIELKWQAHYWRAQHERLVEREAALKAEVAALQATLRALPQRLYGAKSETAASPDHAGESTPARPRKRGQQLGSTGHGRSDRAALPVVTEGHDVNAPAKHCPVCGAGFVPFPGREESNLIAVQVQAHIRRIQRQRYRKTGQCAHVPGIGTAPPAPRLIPQSSLGVSVGTMVLLDNYLYGRPTHRCCEELRQYGLPLAPGTLTEGLQRIAGLFELLRQALHERQMGEKLFHGDETRWEVFAEVEGKTGHRWYLW